ncbi:MAG: carbon-nitrogen hydrolase family protein [Kiritimatiellae bacterium]|nr:carbon-nitrogen hydrolase family protein [Kiritimatiellia bacterium]
MRSRPERGHGRAVIAGALLVLVAVRVEGGLEFNGWRPSTPREELRPEFEVNRTGGPDGQGGLRIKHDQREGLDGAWKKTFEVEGGSHYRITAHARMDRVANPRYHTYVELVFRNADGRGAQPPSYARELPADARGWTPFTDIFQAPPTATHATVELHLRWEPHSEIEWGAVSLVKSGPRPPRIVRLAAANYRPRGGQTAMDNLRQLEPHVAKAAEQRANLVVLGEIVNAAHTGLSYSEVAEPVPGPSTHFLAALAKRHNLHIVTSIPERSGHLLYNTAVLLSPAGELVGKYRKVCPARDEYRRGTAPGREYPVFDTAIGKIGMMICFDVFVPEVARGLAANGAEIIALPIWGGPPALARARALENQVYLVSATYGVNDDWMQSGVWGLDGELLVRATEKGSVVVAEVDLAKQHFWRGGIGEFKPRIRHERTDVPLPK